MSNGARTIVVESPDRFARDLMVQLAGHDLLKAKGISLVAASAPTHFIEDTPTAVLVRQVLGAIAEFEKTTLVAKLAAARRRKRMATGEKVEGRKSHIEARPDVVKLAKALARKKPKGGKLSLRAISAELAAQGFLNERGRPFNPRALRPCSRRERGQATSRSELAETSGYVVKKARNSKPRLDLCDGRPDWVE